MSVYSLYLTGHPITDIASEKRTSDLFSQSNSPNRILEASTIFTNGSDGIWLMADWDQDGLPDLVFVKTSDTPSGNVEVHIASGSSNFQARILVVPTTFTNPTSLVNQNDGTWLMADWDRDGLPDLVFIKTSDTPSGNVEVHIASGSSNFQTRILEVPTTFTNPTSFVNEN